MPITIVATAKATNANSYVTEAEADAYFVERLHATVWTGATSEIHKAALVMATNILESRVVWNGGKTLTTQALRWPRRYVQDVDETNFTDPVLAGPTYLDENTIPIFLKHAQYELAMALISSDRTLDPDTAGIGNLSLTGLSLGFDKTDRPGVLPDSVRQLCSPYGRITERANTVQLSRS